MAQTEYASLLDFHGKVAIVTGAAQGLGAEFAWAFASCGANVVLLDVDDAAVCRTAIEIADKIDS